MVLLLPLIVKELGTKPTQPMISYSACEPPPVIER
jgi:hypothetical protein